jgi:pilus assembly protein CpaF
MTADSRARVIPEAAGKERRRVPRTRVVWTATLETPRGRMDCRVSNVSAGGARVRVPAAIGVGQPVTLVTPSHGEFHGTVAWERDGTIGISFTERDMSEGQNRAAAKHKYSGDPPSPPEPAPPNIMRDPAPLPEPPRPEAPQPMATPPAIVRPLAPRNPVLGDLATLANRLRRPSAETASPEPPTTAPVPSETVPQPASQAVADERVARPQPQFPEPPAAESEPAAPTGGASYGIDERVRMAVAIIHPEINEQIDPNIAVQLPRAELSRQLSEMVREVSRRRNVPLSRNEQAGVVQSIVDEMLGLGPLEPLLADESITDILVNGFRQVYVERRGKLERTDVTFTDDQHVINIALRIVNRVGRRLDESVPLVDARLPDGSRVNVIVPPLALKGPMISIRKFAKRSITLSLMAQQRNLSPAMAMILKIAARCRLNILISGGTGSGKTTLLNAMSQMIDPDERIITIEDAAELQLQLPHVGSLETRPPNFEGGGEITMRDLLKNALRMRPDRIILGEVRGAEAFDMLQAMNTGHDGSLATIHASGPREALSRLESIVAMCGMEIPSRTLRSQIAQALDMIVQVSRMRDGKRRITSITEVVGMEQDVFVTHELFRYEFEEQSGIGEVVGRFVSTGIQPKFMPKAEYYGLHRVLIQTIADPDAVRAEALGPTAGVKER